MEIISHEVEKLFDPTGILPGDRYEFLLNIEVPEDDELYSENGLYIKLIYAVDDRGPRIAQYQIFESITDTYLDFALDEEEEAAISDYCKQFIE
ncbi:DUF6509 family protein [Caldibacillus lycopersici]|uniref:DUF6509 family protein n=1 Tax=Perspicuibacillus lycopersici TaxID=1325689 RepID=A0AAE3IQL1_9BACI|nr:DUF6509 family protein [Perspicuibacillus lycopersici]MCU9612392.1 DUF6509 family protein [Perspicuibacillus lycopersici]